MTRPATTAAATTAPATPAPATTAHGAPAPAAPLPVPASRPVVGGRVLRGGGLSVRVRPRAVVVTVTALVLVAVGGVATLTTGPVALTVAEVASVLAGRGSRAAEFVVLDLRLPRVLLAVGVGVALGVSGAVLQSVSRNPLGSPDVLGFTSGASTGALLAILLFSASAVGVSVAALAGGLVTAVVVVLLAGGRGGDGGLRLVLVGVGFSAMLLALNTYLVSRAALQDALGALAWLVGDLGNRGWAQVGALWVLVVVLVGGLLAAASRTGVLELGDRMAGGLGVRAGRTRTGLLLAAVALASAATAAAGPIAFVALAAPQLARRACRAATPVPVASAAVGAAVVVLADLLAQRALPAPLPVGVATGVLGGLYLVGLLARRRRGER